MNVFITGIAGFLGSHLAEAHLARGDTVYGIDSLIGGDAANVPNGARLAELKCEQLQTSAIYYWTSLAANPCLPRMSSTTAPRWPMKASRSSPPP
jgi:nucleoside-diphosphate-sugar epimerase